MLTKSQYIELRAKTDKTDEEIASIKDYENEHNIIDDASRDEHIAKDNNSADNNSSNSSSNIDDLHEQNNKELEKKLDNKEKSADYQKKQKEKRDADGPTEQKSSSSGFLTLLGFIVLIGGGIYYFFVKQGNKDVSDTSNREKAFSTENRAESSNRETEQRAETLKGAFDG